MEEIKLCYYGQIQRINTVITNTLTMDNYTNTLFTMDCALVLAAPVHWPKMLSRQRECAAYVQTLGEQLIISLAQNGQESKYLDIEIPV